MNLEVKLNKDFSYEPGITSFPVIAEISSVQPIEIAEKIDVNTVVIESLDSDGLMFGYSQCITGIPSRTMKVDNGDPIIMELEAFDEDDDTALFAKGKYLLRVKITTFEKLSTGEFKLHELDKSLLLTI